MEDLINKAGRQRMLCERMVKSYVQVVSGVAPGPAAGELAHSIGVFERQLTELKDALASAFRQPRASLVHVRVPADSSRHVFAAIFQRLGASEAR